MKTKTEELLIEYVEGEMDDRDRRVVEVEASLSPQLRRELRAIETVRDVLRTSMEINHEVDLGRLHEKIMSRIDTRDVKKKS